MDPTITCLYNPKHKSTSRPIQEYDETYKQRILELTTDMLNNKPTIALQDSFAHYVSDCIRYLKQQDIFIEQEKEKEKNKDQEINPINGDQFIFAPKKIDVLVKKKQKNIFLMYGSKP